MRRERTWNTDIRVSGPGLASQRHDAVVHPDLDRLGIGKQDLAEQFPGFLGDLLVRPQEDAQQVAAADDADQRAIRVHHGQSLDVMAVHQPRRGAASRWRGGSPGPADLSRMRRTHQEAGSARPP
jgi:hypothetical protein